MKPFSDLLSLPQSSLRMPLHHFCSIYCITITLMQASFRITPSNSQTRQKGIIVRKMYSINSLTEERAMLIMEYKSLHFSRHCLSSFSKQPSFFSYQSKVLREKMKCIHAS